MIYPWLQNTFTSLFRRATEQSLHHGLLLHGPAGLGKTQGAFELAKLLLCKQVTGALPCNHCQSCNLFEASSHPDFHQIRSEKQLGVDLIRQAILSLQGMAQLSGNKVLIIEQADSMTEAAANALLKTLEEPTANTFLLLISAKPERLLPTILSRCEKVALTPPSLTNCIAWLAEQGHSDVHEQFVQVYGCCPLRILDELEKEQGLTYDAFIQGLSLLTTGNKGAIELAEAWQSDVHQVVLWLQYRCRSLMAQKGHVDNFWQFEQHLINANQLLRNPGVNKVVILCGLLQDLLKLNHTNGLIEE